MTFLRPIIFFSLLLPQLSWAQESQFMEADGNLLHYRIFGTGSPLLIINGGPGMSSEGFIPLAKELSANNKVILYDQRGTGHSKMAKIDASSMNIDLLVNDLELLRKHLELEEWIILGHSFGGMLAYAYAAKFPERVKAMIQSSSGGMDLTLFSQFDITAALTATERDSLRFYSEKIASGDTTRATQLKRAEFLAHAYVYNKKHIPVIAKRLTQGNRTINSLLWNDMRQRNFDAKSGLQNFQKPVLILHGENDVVNPELSHQAHQLLPGSRLVLLPNTGHYGWLDAKELYFSAISKFLSGL
ncbi:alpha/beta fold hydrolase [Salinimicrobium sp. TH3]|uniref:alpha/beta fold hydrolase n=1 Tax=Salinimicrobium sp. TH3 TaxID=2997342 RepID=UPI002275FAC9|nr:alpha/beta fold hydrolase [Salinimicrobium sp. TH3]MCY2687326.1 alpha/beta fold hydrolase [Salinimicrobium sp. TH3]